MFSQNMPINKQMVGRKENNSFIPTGSSQNNYLFNLNITDKNGTKMLANSQIQKDIKGEIKK